MDWIWNIERTTAAVFVCNICVTRARTIDSLSHRFFLYSTCSHLTHESHIAVTLQSRIITLSN